ncbi:MAG: UDP-2,3-diacylglucosamine diphosphatase LpxI [Alphaproteobacteria bacterium]|nr:MAG: UDP-2,3-diacylglucosamine diphosphatase LpxI [Alphaproteobacteria bacterium]
MTKVYALLGGGGLLPASWAELLTRQKNTFLPIGFAGVSDKTFVTQYSPRIFRLGAIQKIIHYLKNQGVTHVMMVGYFTRPTLFSLLPDWKGFLWLLTLMKQRGDDSYLRCLIRLLEAEGFQVCSPEDISDDDLTLLPACYTHVMPSASQRASIARGIEVLAALSPVDVGQAVVVNNQHVLGIEAVEGTQGLLSRCALYLEAKGAVLVKCAKAGQDLRLDRPTIGPDTIDQLVAAGFAGVAVQARCCYVIDAQKTLEKANESGVFVCAVDV